jgi:hypothetical protein
LHLLAEIGPLKKGYKLYQCVAEHYPFIRANSNMSAEALTYVLDAAMLAHPRPTPSLAGQVHRT